MERGFPTKMVLVDAWSLARKLNKGWSFTGNAIFLVLGILEGGNQVYICVDDDDDDDDDGDDDDDDDDDDDAADGGGGDDDDDDDDICKLALYYHVTWNSKFD